MEFVGSDDILDDMLLPSSSKTEQNVSKFAPKPGCKPKKPPNKKAKPSITPNAIEVHPGKDANVAESDAVAKITKPSDLTCELDAGSTKIVPVKEPSMLIKETNVLSGENLEAISDEVVKPTDSPHDVASTTIPLQNASAGVDQSGSQCPETETSLQHDTDNVQQDLDDMLMISSLLTVKQRNKLQLKSALHSKGSKKKSVKFSFPLETEEIPSRERGLASLDLNMTSEPIEGDLSNWEEEPLVNIANDHAELPDNDEEFEAIDEIMDIDSWDEPSVPAKMENNRAGKTSRGSSKRNSTGITAQNDNLTNNNSGDIVDLIESNVNDENFTPLDEIVDINSWDEPSIPSKLGNGTNNTTKRKRKPSGESEPEKVKEPKKRIPHGTRRKKRQVDKALLEKSEQGIDPTEVPLKDLILIAEAKEKIMSKEAASSMANSNNDSHIADDGNPLDEGFDPDSEEAHRHWLKNAKKINYGTHMKISRSKKWSKEDTASFYDAVRDFKTNFAMMVWLFPGRTSRQIKAKFKAEERKHPLELHDALEYRSKDHSLFGKVIEMMKERKKEEDAAGNETDEMDQTEMEENGANLNQKADDSDKTDLWNDGDFDFNETVDWEFDADVPLAEDKEDKVDSKKKKVVDSFVDEVDSSGKKDLWEDDFGSLELNECEDLELETDAASTQIEENKEEK